MMECYVAATNEHRFWFNSVSKFNATIVSVNIGTSDAHPNYLTSVTFGLLVVYPPLIGPRFLHFQQL